MGTRMRWKQAGLILLSCLAVFVASQLVLFLVRNQSLFVDIVAYGTVCLVTYLVAVIWIEWRAPTELSPHQALPEFGAGLLVGVALFLLVMAILWLVGVYQPKQLLS